MEKKAQGPVGDWYKDAKNIKGILTDIYGVLYDSDKPIPGSVNAIARLKASGVPIRFCSNTSSRSKSSLAEKLRNMGFDVKTDEIFTPAPLAAKYLKEEGLRPLLLVKDSLLCEFKEVDQTEPNCVLIGDAADKFSYQNLNKAFHTLLNSEKPVLLSMGKGKYYSNGNDGMQLDVGPYMKALEYACDCEAHVIGKPSPSYFQAALEDMGLKPSEVVMIGDDINYDAGGAQKVGMKGIQVRTGKYRINDEPHPVVTPDGYVDDFAQAVDLYLNNR